MKKLVSIAGMVSLIAGNTYAAVSMPSASTSNTDPMDKWVTIRDWLLNAGVEIGFGLVVLTAIIILIKSLRGGFQAESAGKTAAIGAALAAIPFFAEMVLK